MKEACEKNNNPSGISNPNPSTNPYYKKNTN
jgi:hypothetical protein